MFSCAWIWMYIGCALMLLELATSGFIVFFFGLGAVTAACCRFIWGDSFTLTMQLGVFAVASVVYLVVLRGICRRIFHGEVAHSAADFEHEAVGRLGEVREAINPPHPGRVMLGDAEWTAVAAAAIAVGTQVKVTAQENLTLTVTPLA